MGNISLSHLSLKRVGNIFIPCLSIERVGNISIPFLSLKRVGNKLPTLRPARYTRYATAFIALAVNFINLRTGLGKS